MPQVLIYGGCGALGSTIVKAFKAVSWTVFSADFQISKFADHSIVVPKNLKDTSTIVNQLRDLKAEFDAVISVAGGFQMSTIKDESIFDSVETMVSYNLYSAVSASHLASRFMKEKGLLVLTGAEGALRPTPIFLSYGISKAACHHLVKSLAEPNSGMPKSSTVIAMLPITLDTPQNRKDMPTANFNNWTPLESVAEILLNWCSGKNVPTNGQLMIIKTEEKKTSVYPAQYP